ncbi:D-alanyl-D-alanine carboxypeptidase [Streptomyces bobili]|uniref:serine hydrolase n=1 Tax=Streptomyces bobili TaxID=67280 RepID=UPI00224F17E8|nr:serine hydrolase [Streptomyces bobili]MCX5524732.1 D-alanyl-D-alanine carboxypeptidase [Streptomyces bobili]
MAGESPDRSKQRESSAEPTSGSAGAVPEARDPRLAVARDAESASPAPSAGSRGGVDTATRVLSVRELTTAEADDEPDAEPDVVTDVATDVVTDLEAAPDADDRTDAEPDAQADDEPDEDSAEGATEDSADDSADDSTDSAGGNGDEGPDADSDDPEGSTEAEEAAESPEEAPEGSPEGSEEPSGAAEGPDGPEDAEDAETASADTGDRDDRLRSAVAQWVTSADAKPDAKPDEASGEATPAPEPELEKGSGKSGKSEEHSAAADDATTPEDSDTKDSDTENSATDRPSKPAPKWATSEDTDAAEIDDEEVEVAKDAEDTDTEDAASDEPASPVDQPTAVFSTVRPPAEREVDQPTTMLKLGDLPKAKPAEPAAAKVTEAKPKPAPAPEPGSEKPEKPAAASLRTSKFVPLKPQDDSAVRPVRPAADSTAVVPQIGPERTTQQPLPPKPPLDLLAELTNTPPPPPTPLRTLGRRLKIWTPLVLLLVIAFAIAQAVRPLPATALTLTAQDSYTFKGSKLALPWSSEGQGWMDVDGVGTMDSFGEQKPIAIGSVAKTMTAYVVLQSHALKTGEDGPEITVDAIAEKEGGYNQSGESTLNSVKAGDKLTLQQALSAIMIPSANNVARLLARWDAGSEAAFVEKMNAAAKELGMTNTTYTDPSGLKETTVSTAEDQVKLGSAVVKIPALVAITSAASWTDPSGYNWSNYNELPYKMGAIGIKTGSTSAAGGNLLFAARKKVGGETVTIVGAVLGQHKPTILKTANDVSRTALTAAQDALAPATILKKGDVVGYVDDKLGGHTPVVVTKDVTAVGWAGLTVKLTFAGDEVPHTAKAGSQVGTLTVGDGTSSAVKVPVALQDDLVEPGFSDKLTRIA